MEGNAKAMFERSICDMTNINRDTPWMCGPNGCGAARSYCDARVMVDGACVPGFSGWGVKPEPPTESQSMIRAVATHNWRYAGGTSTASDEHWSIRWTNPGGGMARGAKVWARMCSILMPSDEMAEIGHRC